MLTQVERLESLGWRLVEIECTWMKRLKDKLYPTVWYWVRKLDILTFEAACKVEGIT